MGLDSARKVQFCRIGACANPACPEITFRRLHRRMPKQFGLRYALANSQTRHMFLAKHPQLLLQPDYQHGLERATTAI
jgi:hypothetical protein